MSDIGWNERGDRECIEKYQAKVRRSPEERNERGGGDRFCGEWMEMKRHMQGQRRKKTDLNRIGVSVLPFSCTFSDSDENLRVIRRMQWTLAFDPAR
ncbi:hypothetical protein L6452_37041 [Arctium lappa]|uniref:Uncharacterized protein n=1 Tax=Arctium lappa TaxID=4217 RepID=A0ACB8Y194_ARCLA|nr:hypothetical protein L6452_37041 [Arctium lappa]